MDKRWILIFYLSREAGRDFKNCGKMPCYPIFFQQLFTVISPPEVSIYHSCRAYPQYKRPLQLLQHYHIYIYVYAHLSFL